MTWPRSPGQGLAYGTGYDLAEHAELNGKHTEIVDTASAPSAPLRERGVSKTDERFHSSMVPWQRRGMGD